MTVDYRLEAYLATLDKALGSIPISDRADIITEIKSHILDSQQTHPEQSLNSILASLGEPETVANRYLLERGLKPGKPSKSPMIKWLTIGFLGTFGMFCLMTVAVIWKFSPIISVNESEDRVILLGGMIDVDGKAGTVKVGSNYFKEDEKAKEFDGATNLDASKIKEIQISFTNGKMEVRPSINQQIRWRCKVKDSTKDINVHEGQSKFALDFMKAGGVRCDLELPAGIKTVMTGHNGKLEVERPQSALEIVLNNGKVSLEPDKSKNYRYDLKVSLGKVGEFTSSQEKDAIPVKISVNNGIIERE